MCERELETEQNCNTLTSPILWPPVFLSRSPVLLNRRSGAQLSAGCWLSLPHLVSKLSDRQKTSWISCALSYIIVQRPLLWNGMFVRHRVEITVMQFTGHSLPVHQSVTVPWDFNPIPYFQPSSPTAMEYALPPSLEWHVWRGRRSIYNTKSFPLRAGVFNYLLNIIVVLLHTYARCVKCSKFEYLMIH